MDPSAPRLSMSDDTMEIIAENEVHRHRDRSGLGLDPLFGRALYTVDEWASLFPCGYRNRASTFAPEPWPTATELKQAEFTRLFSLQFPEVQRLLLSVPGVCVAGGAAAWPFLKHDSSTGDVDLFVYANDGRSLMYKADEVARKLRAEFSGAGMSEALSPGLVTFLIWRDGACSKIQLILRGYADMDELLYGFDVGSCCVGFDGTTTFMTRLAMFSLLHRVNIVFPLYRSVSYEARLQKYFDRGVALVLPHLVDGALVAGAPLVMPHITLMPRVVRGRFAAGTVATSASGRVSDYDTSMHQWMKTSSWNRIRRQINKKNIALVASGKTDFVVLGESLPYAAYAESPPTLSEILPLCVIESYVDSAIASMVTRQGLVNIACLRWLFRMTDAQLSTFTVAACEAACRRAGAVDAANALRPFRLALLEKYRAATERAIEWCIVVDPQRQYTASRNPTPESNRAWYGDRAFSETQPADSTDESLVAIFGRLEARRPSPCLTDTDVSLCALCQYEVKSLTDKITLKCGHTFHWEGDTGGCRGLYAWAVALGRDTCPMCRRVFGAHRVECAHGAFDAQARVPLEVDWT
jgi:hypothetical protein